MLEQNKLNVKRAIEDVWNNGNLPAANHLFAEDYMEHTVDGDFVGAEEYLQYISGFQSAFPDIKFKVHSVLAEADLVAARWTASGTHKGKFQGIPPTGEEHETEGITIFRFANGKIVEVWGHWDRIGLLQQLGAIPAS